jgi:hypothetical protein
MATWLSSPAQANWIATDLAFAEMLLSMMSESAVAVEYPNPRKASIMADARGGANRDRESWVVRPTVLTEEALSALLHV